MRAHCLFNWIYKKERKSTELYRIDDFDKSNLNKIYKRQILAKKYQEQIK